MKFRKPQWSGETAGRFYFDACMTFISDLPDEFEILGPGEVAVKWPEDLTADYLRELADCVGRGTPRIGTLTALLNLAAIAPERKKRRETRWVGWHDGEIVMRNYGFDGAIRVEIED